MKFSRFNFFSLLLLGLRALFIWGFLLTTNVYAQLTPFTCSSNLYLIQNGTGASSSTMAVNLTDTSTSPFTYTSLGASASHFYNAVGYNTNDNFMYGILGNSNNLIKIGNNGATQDLGAVNNLPTGAGIFYNSGAFDLSGNFYVKEGSTTTLYKINTTTLTATAITLSQTFFSADIAWHQGNLYAIDTSAIVYKINPTNGVVTTIGNAGNPTTDVLFGALYGSPNGLFAVQNSGGFFEFDVNTGARILISPSPATSSNDGAHCATQNVVFGTDLEIIKTNNQDRYVPGQITYTITVTNKGPFGAFGATVSDPLPSGISTATWTCTASTGSSCTASGTGAINDTHVNLLLNGTATYTSTITVPSTRTSNLVNTATVSVGDSSIDNNGNNNSSVDTDLPAPKLVTVKTASQTPLVVGQTGQSYQIKITVTNGPTTAAITIADTLPSGITTSGAITATGGTLSGCPAAGATSLSGCSIASGVDSGTITITVPVNVASGAAASVTNTATVSGGGDPRCPAGADCKGSVTTPVIDALDDAVTKQPNISTTSTLSGNDQFPTGSTFSQESTTCSPAGTVSSSGQASYTTPSANSSCTVTYKVCAPSPNQTVCDTAVLTVNSGDEPSYTVTKTASQSPFVVGATGQSYKIRITVRNGPTTAPITIADTLPTGMTTSGAITATGGTLSGCPATGASNLSGCSIAAGVTNGNIDITVPVTIAATAANPSVNQATASGGGSTQCPADASCSGSNSNPVIDAVNDAVNKQPHVVTTTNVSANDKFPTGSTFTQESTTCSPAGTMSSDGVASYTTPAADSSCTVTYKVCAPSPNEAICDTAVLTVNAGKEPSYTVTKTTSQTPLVVGQSGQSYQITIALTDGPTTADLTISDTLPAGITTHGDITATGATISSCPATGATSLAGCKIQAGAVSGNIVITVPVAVGSSVASSVSNTASASGGGSSKCPGDASCSGSVTTPVINAINEAVNKPAHTITSTNVSGNDVFPAGSTFSQVATTCSPAGTTSSDGVISYQSPGNNSSCTVTYKVCAPSPNQAVCDTAVLTVTVGDPPSLTVVKSSSSSSFTEGVTGQYYTLTITVKNGPTTEDVVISDTLPAGMTISEAITVSGTGVTLSGCPAVGASNLSGCHLLPGLPNGIFKIKVPVNVSSSAVSPSHNTVTLSGGGDPKCTGVAPACTSENTIIVSSQKIDVVKAVALPVQISEKVFDIEYGIVVKNVGHSSPTVFNVQVNDDLNDTFPTAQNITVSQYSVSSYSGSAVCTPAAQFTGVGSFTQLLAGTDDLTGDQACGIEFKVRVDYGSNPVPTVTQNNLAIATGTASNATSNPGISSSANTSFNANNIPAGISTLDMSVNSVSSNTSQQVVLPSPPSIRGGDTSSGTPSPTVLSVNASLQLSLKKSVSQTEAVAGDVLTYKITIKNPTLTPADAQITDTPPAGFEYVVGSAKVAGRAVEAKQTGANLIFTINSIAANASVTLVYQMKVTEQIVAGKLQNCANLKNTSSGSTSAESCASVIVKTGLLLEKITSQENAEIGDTVEYALRVKSIGGATENVTITDQLPLGFKLIAGLSKLIKAGVSTTFNNIQGAPGPVLIFNVGTVGHNEIVEVRYRVRVDFGAELGDGVNSAQAKAPYANSSLVKKVKLKIKPGVFTREVCIVGMVYADCNQNQMKEKEELSIPYVRLYLEDGSSLVTDRNGQYSVCGIRAISHVVKVDSKTMPTGSVLGIQSNGNLGSAGSVLLHVKAGELARADFTEVSCQPEVIEQIQVRSNQLLSKPALGNQKQKTFNSKNAPAVGQCAATGSKMNCEVQGGVNEK